MASTSSHPFTQATVRALKKIYPEHLADKSFDNTGLLLEAPFEPNKAQQPKNAVLLAIDLTTAVADEAIEQAVSCVVAYHPIIFHALKSLTLANTQQRSLLRLAAAGISVYVPHTAVDAAEGGNADWLADIVTGEAPADQDSNTGSRLDMPGSGYYLYHMGNDEKVVESGFKFRTTPHDRQIPRPDGKTANAGFGRLVKFHEPVPFNHLLRTVTAGFGGPQAFSLAVPQASFSPSSTKIGSVAVCAGSGGPMFTGVDADLYLSGELDHHEALALVEKGKVVICLSHSNSERGYLRDVMKGKLEVALKEEWSAGAAQILISSTDRDPFGVAIKIR